MEIDRFLEGRVFDPDRARLIGIVFDRVCEKLGLTGSKDFLARIVARTIIDTAEGDNRDPDLLTAKVIQKLGLPERVSALETPPDQRRTVSQPHLPGS